MPNLTHEEAAAELMRFAMLSANEIAIRPPNGFRSWNERDTAVVQRAIEALAANGYIKIIPRGERPGDYVAHPPYNLEWPS